jgi:electron transfer flavoprotein alpha/beta subunit
VGGQEVEPFLATLRALGYERTARVAPGADLDFAPAVTAAIVVAYAQQIDHSELVLLGCRSGPGDGGTVPFRVAEALGWLCLTQVTEVEPLSDGRLRVAWVADDGLLRASLRLPCVLAIGNAIVSRLRVPTLSDRLTVRHRQSDVVSPADLGVDVTAALARECSALVGFEVVDRSRPGVVVGGRTPREKAQAVFDAYIRQLVQQT